MEISSIFFADVYAGHEVYGGSMEATYAGGSQVGVLDPVVMIGPMAAVTKSVGFVVTGSSSYIREAQEKFDTARKQAHVLGGLARFGGFTGVDLSPFPLDEPFEFKGELTDVGIHSAIENLKANPDIDQFGKERLWTPRKIGEIMAMGGDGKLE
ncbi:hypothetical protein M7I_7664 [Glarea lozoyensis 74030]|uniref:Uncharacterized protein n=1 Tax=Glarea lozoyensis (strain ATCC 74030 / MF5533) TaxID=1104152 RepID=H0EXX1_GLAL7|nr:hypothetical protein M7I_7664 [Glarea lozoyensis 74030]